MPNESIGGISVSISVGLQDLQAQFEQAQQMADAAGKAMASAFNSSTGSLNQLGDAASGATQKVDSLSSSLSTAASGLTNAGLVFSALSAGIIGVGAASLEAAGKFEQWDVSFTRLLGSETAAKNMLEDLVNFAIKTPFEIPDVVNNAQRLMAFGFAAEQVIPTLTALGDAVAKMGRGGDSLNSLVLAFGEMSAKGVVQLRQLNMMTNQGVEAIKILADAYGVSTESMSASITKKLVPAAEAIPILLKGIEESSSGMMDKQSETFKGMASNLSDAMTKTFKAIGDTMLPLFKSLEQAAFSLLTFVQNLAEGFAKLPVPVQETAIAVAALVAGIGPLLLGLGAISFALKSLIELPAAFGALSASFGLASTGIATVGASAAVATPAVASLALAETTVAEATAASTFQLNLFQAELNTVAAESTIAGTQLGLLGPEIGAISQTSTAAAASLGTASLAAKAFAGGLAILGIASVVVELGDLATKFGDVYDSAKAAVDGINSSKTASEELSTALKTVIPGMQDVSDTWDSAKKELGDSTWADILNPALAAAKKALDTLKVSISEVSDSWPGMAKAAEDAGTRLKNAADKAAHDTVVSMGGFFSAATEGAASLEKLREKEEQLQQNVDTARAALERAAEGLKNGTVDQDLYRAAAEQLNEALKKVAKSEGDTASARKASENTLAGLTAAYTKNQGAIDTLSRSIAQLLAIENRSAQQEGILDTAIAKRWDLIQKNIKAIGEQMGAEDKALTSAQQMVKSASELTTKEQAATLAVGLAKAALDELTSSTDKSATHQRAVTDALNQYASALKNTGIPLSGLITLTKDGVQYTTTLAEALGHAKDGMTAFSDEAVAVPQSVDKAWEATDQFGRALRETVDGTNGVIDVLRALPPVAAEAKRQFDQIGYGAGNSTALIKGLTDEMSRNIAAAGKAVNANSALVNSINHVGEATSDALAVEKAWTSGTSTAVDNTSKFANSVSHAASELHNMVTAADKAGTAAFDADKSFKATTGSVNALSVGVAFLAMQLSGLTVFAGSGINYAAGQSDLQHQLYLARQAAGDPTAQPANFAVSTGGALKGQTANSLSDLNQALSDLQKTTDAAATSAEKLSNATAKSTQSTLQYVDGVGNIYDSYQKMIDAIAANPNLGGLTSTIDRLSSTATTANTATQQASQAQQQFVDGLGNVYDSYQALTAAIAANPLLGGPATSSTGDKISGPSSMPSTMAEALANMTKLATPNGATGDSKIPNVLGTFNGQVITGSPGMSLSDAIALMHIGVGSGSGAVTALPGSMVTSNGTSNYTPVPSNQQGGQGIVVNMNYPSFNSQQQADQVMKQVVTQLRTVTGLKL